MNQNYHQRTGGKGNVHVADGTHACFKLIGAACDAGVQTGAKKTAKRLSARVKELKFQPN